MKAWLKAFNPLATIDNEAEALMAARASSVTLWLSGAKWIAAAILVIEDMPRLKAAFVTDNSNSLVHDLVGNGLAEATVAITAAIGLFQVMLGGVQWRAPNTVIPIIFLILSTYGLGNALWQQVMGGGAGSGWTMVLSYFTLVVAVIFHWIGLRGARRLETFHRV